MESPVEALEEKLGYHFKNRNLLVRAVTHRSWLSERQSPIDPLTDNEQFEFLGDSILGFVVSESLVARHPSASEGKLSKWKAHLVSGTHLHARALELDLGSYLRLGRGEEKNLGRDRKTLLANAFEAVIAAIHVDGGIDAARTFIQRYVLMDIGDSDQLKSIDAISHKNALYEKAQALGLPHPRYEVVASSGPDHVKVFTIEARIGERFVTRASGPSKKEAGQRAALKLIGEIERMRADAVSSPTLDGHPAAD